MNRYSYKHIHIYMCTYIHIHIHAHISHILTQVTDGDLSPRRRTRPQSLRNKLQNKTFFPELVIPVKVSGNATLGLTQTQ